MSKRYRVAFICTRNSCRSQIAEAFARSLASDVIEPFSGGIEPGLQLDNGAVETMKEIGIDISGSRPKRLPQEILYSFDLVVHMGCGSEQCLEVPGVPSEEWSIEDPADGGPEEYRQVREVIRAKVVDLADRLRSEGMDARSSAARVTPLRIDLV